MSASWREMKTLDGHFFIGVKTTGVYCRPVCKVKIPKRENMISFKTAAEAEENGYRPCLRCRPETAPFCPAWNGSKTSVSKALALIDEGFLDSHTVDDLADRLGLGSRQLRKLVRKHLGTSPAQLAKTRRIQKAKLLIETTDLKMSEIGIKSGFKNSQAFNKAFRELYGRTPMSFRK